MKRMYALTFPISKSFNTSSHPSLSNAVSAQIDLPDSAGNSVDLPILANESNPAIPSPFQAISVTGGIFLRPRLSLCLSTTATTAGTAAAHIPLTSQSQYRESQLLLQLLHRRRGDGGVSLHGEALAVRAEGACDGVCGSCQGCG